MDFNSECDYILSRQRETAVVLVNKWWWRVCTILCIISCVWNISRLLESWFWSAAILCFCTHIVMEALPMELSPLAFEKVGCDLWMTRPPSASWLHLLPSSITTTAIWVRPPPPHHTHAHTHLCFLGLCHRESGQGWSTEAEVKSKGQDAAAMYQAPLLPPCSC